MAAEGAVSAPDVPPGAAVLDPPVLDAHAHVWRPSALPYPWLDDVPALRRDVAPSDIDDAGGRIREWVFVEADADPRAAIDEVAWVSALDWPGLRAIVAHADLVDDALERHLDALAAFPLVRGVRHPLQDAPADVLASARFASGLRRVGERGLAFDACVRWWQLDALADAVAQAPGTPVVLDHVGKPPLAEGLDGPEGERWREGLGRLAALPHVSVKLSGLAAEAPTPAVFDALGPETLRIAFAAFGADRSMFGGDWPVSGPPGTGVPIAAALDHVRAAVPAQAHGAVLGGTARRFYGLATP